MTHAALSLRTRRRTFLAYCVALAGASALPFRLRLNALRAYAALDFALTAHERAVLAAAVDTIVPATRIVTRRDPPPGRLVPSASETGAVEFIANLLDGSLLFAAGVRRPPYVGLPAGSVARATPGTGALPMWPVKAMGWFGDPGPRPTRPRPWPSELARLQQLYRQGVRDLDASTVPLGFAASPPAAREAVLREIHALEAVAYDGQGEGRQPFFLTLLDHVAQACFGDPVYGGNRDWAYWELINFPGPSLIDTGGPSPGQGWTWRDLTGPFDRTWKPA